MKKLLIIQQDEAYFLFETIQVIEKNPEAFKNYDLTILVKESSYREVYDQTTPLLKVFTADPGLVQNVPFDVTVNLSLCEESWDVHGSLMSKRRIGAYKKNGDLIVEDNWSSFLFTLKGRAPFLTFHLQDIYKNILGIKSLPTADKKIKNINQIIVGTSNTSLFSADEQEKFINELSFLYPAVPIRDLTEVDLVSDVTGTLFIGPPTLTALKICEAGATAIFLSSVFKGFNLLPYNSRYHYLSSRQESIKASPLIDFIKSQINGKPISSESFSIYRPDVESFPGQYLECLTKSDDNFPFYQSHVVLWNFLLNLTDTDLEVTKCTPKQLELLKTHKEVLTKFIRLHDYAMVSIDTIYQESKAPSTNTSVVEGHLKNLRDIEKVSDQIAGAHPILRPFLDFYRLKRGQNQGQNLNEQSQNSFLAYAEEHQALVALSELFSVTLRKNDANI